MNSFFSFTIGKLTVQKFGDNSYMFKFSQGDFNAWSKEMREDEIYYLIESLTALKEAKMPGETK